MIAIGCRHRSGLLLCYAARKRHDTVRGFGLSILLFVV